VSAAQLRLFVFTLWALVPCPAGIARAQGTSPARDLESLLALAEKHYPGIEARAHEIDAARAQLDDARVSPFLQFRALGNFAFVPGASGTPIYSNDTQVNISGTWGPTAGATVEGTLPLVTFGKLRAVRQAARVGVSVAEIERDRSLARVRLDVIRAYMALQLALDLEVMVDEGIGILEKAIRTLDEREEKGEVADPMDSYRLEAAIAEIRARSADVRLLAASARAALRALTGVAEVAIPDCPIEPYDIGSLDDESDESFELSITLRPEAALIEAAIAVRELEVKMHRARFFPDLAIAARANAQLTPGRTNIVNPFIADAPNARGLAAGVVMRWELDFYGALKKVDRARALLRATESQRREARAGMRLEVDEARARIRTARERLEAFHAGERSTRAWSIAALQGYQVGTTEVRTLIDSIRAYYSQRGSRLQAVHDLNVAIAGYGRVSGAAMSPEGGWNASCVLDD
jgi:outer membrane protein, multidrug efflux system